MVESFPIFVVNCNTMNVFGNLATTFCTHNQRKEVVIDTIAGTVCEYEEVCKKCGKVTGCWAYGSFMKEPPWYIRVLDRFRANKRIKPFDK